MAIHNHFAYDNIGRSTPVLTVNASALPPAFTQLLLYDDQKESHTNWLMGICFLDADYSPAVGERTSTRTVATVETLSGFSTAGAISTSSNQRKEQTCWQ